ncbi:regulator of G-protein signaling 13 [Microcaecilia unicolor]|uniref:Regulator of G-protein signaling 13 n=1 Tax=Microcaecilia unicolor TaxID=1415580 RepID=A0A6P7YCW2_9AMPH|nr:regulator of G-protein signaling 13 [Microcaecilia unicolor]
MSPKICWLCRLSNTESNETSKLSLDEVLQWSQSLQNLMATKYGPVVYRAYLRSEYSDENIEFWFACENYTKIRSQWKRISRAKKLFKMYIQPNSPREINIDSPIREAIVKNLQAPTEDCFAEAQQIVYRHMERDSYPRFLESNIYQNLKNKFQTEQLLGNIQTECHG